MTAIIKSPTALSKFKHRVVLASSYTEGQEKDNPASADIILKRTIVKEVSAAISPIKGSFYLNGFAMEENRNLPSHSIYIRYNRDIDITGFAWVYEERPSGRRWYKVLTVQEVEEQQRFWQFKVRLQQKSEAAVEPVKEKKDDFLQLPKGARL